MQLILDFSKYLEKFRHENNKRPGGYSGKYGTYISTVNWRLTEPNISKGDDGQIK